MQNIIAKHGTVENVVQISTDILQVFANAPASIGSYIRLAQFTALIEDRTRNFVGRDFVFSALDSYLVASEFSSGYILIRGEPGIGKTSLLAQLVKTRGYVHHFNIATQNIGSVAAFLENVCAQLIVRYHLDFVTLPPEASRDSGFLSQLLGEIASKSGSEPVVILVDAVDEAEELGLNSTTNKLYLPPILPDRVFFVLTSREQVDYRLNVERLESIHIRDDDPRNRTDVCKYIESFLHAHQAEMVERVKTWKLDPPDFTALISDKSGGNFMYVVQVLRDIRSGLISKDSLDDINQLPNGLQGYYQRHWRFMRSRNEDRFDQVYEPVLGILAAVREPVPASAIAEWTGIHQRRVKEVINEWRQFLNEGHSPSGELLYRVYHTSFQDFLAHEGVGLGSFHEMIAKSALGKIRGFSALTR